MMLPIPGKERVRAKTGDSELRDGKGRGGPRVVVDIFKPKSNSVHFRKRGGGRDTVRNKRKGRKRREYISSDSARM